MFLLLNLMYIPTYTVSNVWSFDCFYQTYWAITRKNTANTCMKTTIICKEDAGLARPGNKF